MDDNIKFLKDKQELEHHFPQVRGCGFYTLENPAELNCYYWTRKYLSCRMPSGIFRDWHRLGERSSCEREHVLWKSCWSARMSRATGDIKKAQEIVDEANRKSKEFVKPLGDPIWKKRKVPPIEFRAADLFEE